MYTEEETGSVPHETLVSTTEVHEHLEDPTWVVVDCRFSLADTSRGRREYLEAHVPGAAYAHLDEDLSGPVIPGVTGRHPLPEVSPAERTFARLGIGPESQVVAYDDANGGIAARLWWLLGWLGHDAVALMDGGWPRWLAEGRPTADGEGAALPPGAFVAKPRPERVASADDVATAVGSERTTLIDARAEERYRGAAEPIDAVAGHIPGAVSVPWRGNVGADGGLLPKRELRDRFEAATDRTLDDVICYCGSGVTANHDVLAMVHAGLPRPRLYPGSWSEWITDPDRRVAVGM